MLTQDRAGLSLLQKLPLTVTLLTSPGKETLRLAPWARLLTRDTGSGDPLCGA